jgi:hypothetical protein
MSDDEMTRDEKSGRAMSSDATMESSLDALLGRRPRVSPPAGFARATAQRAALAEAQESRIYRLQPLRWGPSLLPAGLLCLLALMLWCATAPQGIAIFVTEAMLCSEFLVLGAVLLWTQSSRSARFAAIPGACGAK